MGFLNILRMLKINRLEMRQLVLVSLYVIMLCEELLKLKETAKILYKRKLDITLLNEQIILLEIKKETYKNFISRRVNSLSNRSSSFIFKHEEFLPFTRKELEQGYAYLGKDGTHVILFRNGLIIPTSGNYQTFTKELSALEFFNLEW